MATMPYNNQWRSIRRMFHQHFNQNVTPNYRPKQAKEVHTSLRRCLEQPTGRPVDPLYLRLTLATIILDIAYGLQVKSMDDEYIKLVVQSMDVFSESRVTGRFWVDFMPFLKYIPPWVPGAAAVKYGAQWLPKVREMVNRPFDLIKQQLDEKHTTIPSMAQELITGIALEQDPVRGKEEEQHARYAAGIAYAGGADTTYSLLQTFFCCMAKYPELQKKAQEELDTIVGPDRMPTYDDYDSLFYVRAIFMECGRWLPVVPLSLPRRALADDHYKGYFIPEGTVIFANIWHILRDPQEYPEPDRFYPDRFIKDGVLNPEVRDPSTVAFGFGRRTCPGRHLAKDTAFLMMASALHVFTILPAVDGDGKELDTTVHMTTGLLSYPDKLNYTLKPRSEVAETLIRATA